MAVHFQIPMLAQAATDTTNPWLIIIVAAISAGMGMGLFKLLGYLRKRDAEKEAQSILEKAEITAAARRKEAI